MQVAASQLEAFMREHDFSQTGLANAAGVSQSTVSRALGRVPGKHSKAYAKLCKYAETKYDERDDSAAKGVNAVNAAFRNIWDGTARQAMAIAKIIEALGSLDPSKGQRHDEQDA
jgi:transcriptional regulator with XRE-family HTH domain